MVVLYWSISWNRASHNQGVEELIDHVMAVACDHLTPGKVDFCIDSDESEDPVAAVHRCIHAIAHMIENDAKIDHTKVLIESEVKSREI